MKRVVTFLLAAGLVFALAAPALAAPPSSDPTTDAREAGAWLASKVNASGFISQTADPTKPNLSVSVQAVTAFVAAGVGKSKVSALLGYLGNHTEELVAPAGADDPGALAYLILAATAGGLDPTSFGATKTNLVTRLVATQRTDPTKADIGLFGAAGATFDGATRQGLSLLALHAVGLSNPAGITWLEDQQCADGSFNAYRADTTVPCPAIDPVNFIGSDTNSTAFAVMGLSAQGEAAPAAKGVTELDSVRNTTGGWGFSSASSQAIDPNSTGVVLEAIRTATGTVDARDVSALLSFQVGCTGAAADQGGILFDRTKPPDALATVQALPALTQAALPIKPGTITDGVPTVCPAAATSTTSTTVSTSGSTVSTVATSGSTVSPSATVAAEAELPRTGSSSAPIAFVATLLFAVGALFVAGSRRRRA
jgi:LPXTG-motif cell wall-anchored protein